MFSRIINKWKDYRAKHTDENSKIRLLKLVITIGYRIIMARVYLRSCTSMGSYVRIYEKPHVNNLGEIHLGDDVRVWSNVEKSKLYSGKNGILNIGNNTRINGAHIDAQNRIDIGNNCRIAPYTIILDSDFHDVNEHFSNVQGKSIIIEDDVWITTRVTILKGVRVGKGSVIATGAVVTKDVPPYSVVAGVPAKVIKTLR